jgi:hypothetical protein
MAKIPKPPGPRRPRKPTKRKPNPRDGICVVRGCQELYEGKAKKALHRCKHHRAELLGFKAQFSDPLLVRLLIRAQRQNKPLKELRAVREA